MSYQFNLMPIRGEEQEVIINEKFNAAKIETLVEKSRGVDSAIAKVWDNDEDECWDEL